MNSNYDRFSDGGYENGEFADQGQIFQKYLNGFRDRIFIFLPILLLVAAGITGYLMKEQALYRSATSMQLLRQEETRTGFAKVTDESIRSSDDLNTDLRVFESMRIVRAVADRVKADIKEDFIAPYREVDQKEEDISIPSILLENRKVSPVRNSYIVYIEYVHPRPDVAKAVADYFAEEIANAYASVRSDGMTRAVQDLREQAELQRRKVENIQKDMENFNLKHQTISFDRRIEIEQDSFLDLKGNVTDQTELLDRLNTQWEMVEAAISENKPVTDLGFIRSLPEISQVLSTLSERRLAISDMGAQYQSSNPLVGQQKSALLAAEAELERAISLAIETLQNERKQVLANLAKMQKRYEDKRDELISLRSLKTDYDGMGRELESNVKLYDYLYNRSQETQAQHRDDVRKVRILDPAGVSGKPFSPQLKDALTKGVAGGFFAAALFVGLLIVLDDRVKTSNDIEGKLEVPILGMLATLPGRHKEVRDLIKATDRSPQNLESLNSIVASLRLDPVSRSAKVIMINSTISNEGKSYVSAALGHTFSRFKERIVIVNCDLRGKEDRLLRLSGEGVIPYLDDENKRIKDVIYRSQALGCDVIPAGGLSKHPYALFGSKRFREMIEILKSSYDRVILDTPPSNLFGDALTLVPFCDGAIYVVGFGRARLGIAKQMIEKLRRTKCPLFGAIVNGVKSPQAKTYFPDHYQNKNSYKYYGKKTVHRL